jgi:hypothetical protein
MGRSDYEVRKRIKSNMRRIEISAVYGQSADTVRVRDRLCTGLAMKQSALERSGKSVPSDLALHVVEP